MGYTHYWSLKSTMSAEQFSEIAADLKTIVHFAQNERGMQLADAMGEAGKSPEFFPSYIGFNGVGQDSHESFVIRFNDFGGDYGSDFCKTARKPYDLAVTACLCYLTTATEFYTASSDGSGLDWLAGLELAQAALHRLANRLDLPMGVMADDRWIGPWVSLKTDKFAADFCRDGFAYVTTPGGESYRFPNHDAMKQWFDNTKCAVFSKGGKTQWGDYGKIEPNIWSAYGSFDKARIARIANAQIKELSRLFPAPAENAIQPPAYIRLTPEIVEMQFAEAA